MAPPEKDLEWSDQGVEGAFRFLNRVWRFFQANRARSPGRARGRADLSAAGRAFRRTVHETIQRVTTDIEDFHFNTAISALHELVNATHAYATRVARPRRGRGAGEPPRRGDRHARAPAGPVRAAPRRGALGAARPSRTACSGRPGPPPTRRRSSGEAVQVVVQVDGRVRTRLVVPPEIAEDRLRSEALADDKVQPWLASREVARVVVVPGRLVNIVTRGTGSPA